MCIAVRCVRSVKRLIAKVRQPQPKDLSNQALPLDWLCSIMASKMNRYFAIVAPLRPIVNVGAEARHFHMVARLICVDSFCIGNSFWREHHDPST
jgi:hypothetical protein